MIAGSGARSAVLALLREKGTITSPEVMRTAGISKSQARRLLAMLELDGLARRRIDHGRQDPVLRRGRHSWVIYEPTRALRVMRKRKTCALAEAFGLVARPIQATPRVVHRLLGGDD